MFNLFNKQRRLIFIVIRFDTHSGSFDYPKDLPIPRIGESVGFNDMFGIVEKVHHSTYDTVSQITIEVKSPYDKRL